MKKLKRNREYCQDYKYSPTPNKSILQDPHSYFLQMSNKERRAFDYLLALSNNNKHIYVTQTTIAKKARVSRETVSRWLVGWIEMGLVHSIYRHMTSCVYRVSHWFSNPLVRSKDKGIGYIFSSLKYATILVSFLSLNLLTRFTDSNVTQGKCIKLNRYLYRKERVTVGPQNAETLLPKAIYQIKSLKLTRAGQIRLSIFPNEAIIYADAQTMQSKTDRSYDYFYNKALSWCNDRTMLPNHSLFRRLVEKYNLDPSSPPVVVAKQEPLQQETIQPISKPMPTFKAERLVTRDRTPEEVISEVMKYEAWRSSEAGQNHIRMFGDIKPFWIHELRELADRQKQTM